jgi:ribosomal protein S27AE
MNSTKVLYKKAIRKQILILVSLIFSLISVTLLLPPRDMHDLILLSMLFVVVLYFGIAAMKNQAKEAKCPHCHVDLFEVILSSNMSKVKFNYCPNCGNSVEI